MIKWPKLQKKVPSYNKQNYPLAWQVFVLCIELVYFCLFQEIKFNESFEKA